MRVWSSKMRVFSFDRYIFRMKFPTGFTYRDLLGFARFPGDSTALVVNESNTCMPRTNIINVDSKRSHRTKWPICGLLASSTVISITWLQLVETIAVSQAGRIRVMLCTLLCAL